MNTGTKELKSILEELDELKLPHMAAELEALYISSQLLLIQAAWS